jgi:tRNA A-37 threonylcarbamoyl transferase component Bud32
LICSAIARIATRAVIGETDYPDGMRLFPQLGYAKAMLETYEICEGTILADRYEVVRRLGAGGMATVYLAEDRVLGRRVAVKRLRGEPDDADLERFKREARLGATLSHPNVVTVFDTVAADDGVLIVMEYVEGHNLADEIGDRPLGDERAIEILTGAAAALDHAHANGIVHRDVKPANVLLGDDGSVKLADLGIATAVEATRITTTHDIVGTLAYIAPERLDSTFPGGPESDVYGLAVLAYETLSGERLSRGSTPAEVVHRASTQPAPDLREARPTAPRAAAGVLRRGMDRDPGNRQASASELVDELAAALRAGREEDPEPAVPPIPPATEELPASDHRSRGPRGALIAIAAVALAGLAALVVAIASGDGGEPAGDSTPIAAQESGDEGSGENDGSGRGGEEAAAPPAEEAAPAEPTESAPAEEQASAPAEGDPAALNDEGFALMQEGDYEGAIPVLQQAVDAYPDGSQDLTYAYALFNLGSALRQAGRPDEAIPILEQRLEIPNQTGIVRKELELARADAG